MCINKFVDVIKMSSLNGIQNVWKGGYFRWDLTEISRQWSVLSEKEIFGGDGSWQTRNRGWKLWERISRVTSHVQPQRPTRHLNNRFIIFCTYSFQFQHVYYTKILPRWEHLSRPAVECNQAISRHLSAMEIWSTEAEWTRVLKTWPFFIAFR